MILHSISSWFHPSLYLLTLSLSFLPVQHSFSHTPPPTICPPPSYPPPSHLLCLSLRHVISLSISYLLPVPFCSFRFHNISTPSFHFDILHSQHLLAASMNTSLVSTPYIYLFLIGISLSFSPCMPICLYLLSPSLSGLSSRKGGRVQNEGWTWNGKLFISDSSAAALSTTPFRLKPDEGSEVKNKQTNKQTKKKKKNKSYSSR